MEIILCVFLIVVVANFTGLSTWTVLFGFVALPIIWFVWSVTKSYKQPARMQSLNAQSPSLMSTPRSRKRAPQSKTSSHALSSGLIIRAEPLEDILSLVKDWEMRTEKTHKRERIALIQKGSKKILGTAEVVDCIGPLSHAELIASYSHHLIDKARLNDPTVAKYCYAWVLSDVRRLKTPVDAPLKPGQVKFVNLPPATSAEILAAS